MCDVVSKLFEMVLKVLFSRKKMVLIWFMYLVMAVLITVSGLLVLIAGFGLVPELPQ